MSYVEAEARVCPTCGSPALDHEYCPACGNFLAILPELPTRREWEVAGDREEGAQDYAIPAGATVALPPTALASAPSLRPLLHPSEASRLAIAVIATVAYSLVLVLVLVTAHRAGSLAALVGVVVFTICSLWVTIQVARARRLGRCLRVTQESLPELQAVLDEVKGVLGYTKKVEVYVSSEEDRPIATTSYLGARVIIIKGDLVAELLENGKRPQLTFLLGREVGALKARLSRLDLLVRVLSAMNALKLMGPFLLPYYRATTYSGDQIGLACCGDFDAALEATRRLLVGSQLAPSVRTGAVLPQASLVRRQILPRLAQLFLREPHVANRYVNLLCFGRYHDPNAWQARAAAMTDEEAVEFERLWSKSPFTKRAAKLAASRA